MYSFNYYCFKNIFVWIEPQVKALSVNYYNGVDWDREKISESNKIDDVIPYIQKSYDLIKLKYSKP